MFRLPLFTDNDLMGIISFEDERKLQLLNPALRVSNKLAYDSWIRYFRDGDGQRKWMVVALLSYWLSLSFLPSRTENGTNAYAFHGPPPRELKKLPLGFLYPGSLYGRLDDCANNILRSMGITMWW